MSTIERKRGDNYPIVASIKVNGTPIDISDGGVVIKFSFKLADGSGDVTTVVGVKNAEVVGEVSFTPTVTEMSVAGHYTYDIQRDDNSVIATHLSGTMLLSDDVTV